MCKATSGTESVELTVCKFCWDAIWDGTFGEDADGEGIGFVVDRIESIIHDVHSGHLVSSDSLATCEICLDPCKGSQYSVNADVYCF